MDIEDIGLMILALTVLLPLGAWVVASLQYLLPTEVGLISYFGHPEKRIGVEPRMPRNSSNGIFGTGLHFVPWFWGIKLIRIPKKFFRLVYERDPSKDSWVMSGTMIQVRSKDKQKLLVEATFFLRFAYDNVDLLILMIECEVPFDNEDKLKEWLADAIDPELTTVFGGENYADVMGGLKNEYLNKAVNTLMQNEDSLLRKNGLFADDATKDDPGTGEAYIKFKYIHVSGPLGERLELVETAKLEAQAAQSVADKDSEETAGRILKMVARRSGMTVDDLNGDLWVNPKKRGLSSAEGGYKEEFAYAEDQVKRDRAAAQGELTDIRVGNTDGTPLKDAGVGALLAGFAGFFGGKRKEGSGRGKNPGGGNGGKGKKKNGGKPKDDDDDPIGTAAGL